MLFLCTAECQLSSANTIEVLSCTAEQLIMVALLRRAEQQRWREEDIQQRNLDNARILWARVVEKNRRDVEEKTEMLRAISTLAALISGFALTAFLQFDWSPDYVDTAGAALPLFSATMALTVGLETICVIICSLMLVSVIKTGQSYMSEEEEAVFMDKCRKFIANYR
eukprot:GHRR01023874.1.p1 GENE.GHRR01023874.1~~GHRR01023874.1.p1  ORF type:complete len:168 (+),score=36.21 GHRR01023874.1:469-972(+)